MIEALKAEPSLRHITLNFATTMVMITGLENGGKLWGEAGEGLTQGDPEISGFFSVGWHSEVRDLDIELFQ